MLNQCFRNVVWFIYSLGQYYCNSFNDSRGVYSYGAGKELCEAAAAKKAVKIFFLENYKEKRRKGKQESRESKVLAICTSWNDSAKMKMETGLQIRKRYRGYGSDIFLCAFKVIITPLIITPLGNVY